MCEYCWKEYGAPSDDSPSIRRAVELIHAVYDQVGGTMGGRLHGVIDDWNLDTEDIKWAIDNLVLNDAESECARHLLSMTERERASALARYDEYVT